MGRHRGRPFPTGVSRLRCLVLSGSGSQVIVGRLFIKIQQGLRSCVNDFFSTSRGFVVPFLVGLDPRSSWSSLYQNSTGLRSFVNDFFSTSRGFVDPFLVGLDPRSSWSSLYQNPTGVKKLR